MNTLPSPEEIKAKPFFHKPFFIAPPSDVFAKRAARFSALAQEEQDLSWQAYLNLLAALCQTQDQFLSRQEKIRDIPPQLPRDETWLSDKLAAQLPDFCQALLQNPALSETARRQIQSLATNAAQLSAMPAEAAQDNIWLQALEQVLWTAWSSQLAEDDVPSVKERSHCPCCGEDAVASIILSGGDDDNLRYLHCPRCNSRWNALRAKCTFCNQQSGMQLQQLSAPNAEKHHLPSALRSARAESCDRCKHYRKFFFLREQALADPIADDLASLALDILIGEKDYSRGGYNPFLIRQN